ncbi:AcrR family transcriptional regulator [Rhodobium orientis]|uniref:TetR family transcriptional regulator n=1 Tax=Rhodobium orientis TaxID=34017 RepID=A0A327JF00_9HYPH|nr:TetR/AcrR family transcriptional regulator [Rhodobium orientis]MBB4305589.1 AcrR family transcriptional regulator [Rhodobium orientis]MBK5950853.1 TetR family transcriptional regulator [Rhodobium orientis]RAI24980.1 TetR family transcriptional regulator [Rhodobium orientis]
MPRFFIGPESDDTTRERILKAAILRFSTHSYEQTGFRDLAADVGVDPAYVHRCFGSKQKLFHEALKASLRPERLFVGGSDDLPSTLAREVLAECGANEIRPLDVVIRSFSSPEASRVLSDVLMDDFIAPMVEKRGPLSKKRAALVAALLAGVGILRDVIGADPLLDGDEAETQELIAQAIENLIDGDADNDLKEQSEPASVDDKAE